MLLATIQQMALPNGAATLQVHELISTCQALAAELGEKKKQIAALNLANQQLQLMETDLRQQNEKLEGRLAKCNSQFAFINQISQTIVQVKDEETLFRNVCRIAVEAGKFKMAWIGMFDSLQKKITLLDYNGIPDCDLELFAAPTYQANGPQDVVLRSGRYYLCNDMSHDFKLESWIPFVERNGIGSFMVLPIKKSGNTIGSFNLYATEAHFFDDEEIALLKEVTEDICFALDLFDKERKQGETQALIGTSEKLFRALLEKSGDMKILSSREGKLLYASPSVTTVLGYTLKDLLHTSAADFIHPDDLPMQRAKRQEMLDTPGKSVYIQLRLQHKRGHWVWCESTLTSHLDEPGIDAIVTNFRDITTRKLAELARTESENLVQSIYNASLDAVIIIDVSGRITKWDAKSELLFGWTEVEVTGKTLSETIIPERFRDMHERGMAHYSLTGEGPMMGKVIDLTALRRNGDEFDVSLSITPSQINGQTHFIGFIRDISEKKAIEKQREFDKDNLDALINSTRDHMWSVDRNYKLITFNQPLYDAIHRFTGKKLKKGSKILDAAPSPKQMAAFKESYDRAFEGDSFTDIVYYDLPSESWAEISYEPIRHGLEVVGAACHSRNITKIKKAERQLIYNEKRFRALVENGTDALAVLGPAGNPIYVSPTVEKILGYMEEEVLKMDLFKPIHPDDMAAVLKVWEQVLASPGIPVAGIHSRWRHKNGTWRWLEATLTNMLHDPSVNGIIDNFRDVTDKIRAQEQKEFDKNNLNALINNTRDLMWSVDRQFKLITFNEPFNDNILFMSGKALAKGDNVLSAGFPQEQLTRFKTSYERVFSGESFSEIEYSNIPVEYWTEISYNPIRKGEEVIGAACHSRNITQIKLHEKTIREERILLRTLIDNLPVNVYVKDTSSRKTLSNRADYGYIGFDNEKAVLGKDDSWFFSEETARATRIEEQEIFRSGKPLINQEEHQKKKDGSRTWFLKSKIPWRNQEHEIVGLIGISHDITERKEAEQQLKKSEAFSRAVLGSLSSHIAVIDNKGKIVAVNESWKRFAKDNGDSDLISTGVGSNYYDVCQRSAQSGLTIAGEILQGMHEVMDGKRAVFYLEYPCHSPAKRQWFGMRVLKFDSDEAMIVVSHQNITERKLAEESLLLTQIAIDNSADAFFWMTPDAKIINVNEAACTILGYSRQELLSLSVPDIDANYNADIWPHHFEELRQKGSLYFESVQKSKTGRQTPVEIRANYVRYENMEFNCAFVRDISERKKAEERLMQSEAKLKEAQAIAHTGSWEIDFLTKSAHWSDELYHIFGINKDETSVPSTELFLSFVHPDDVVAIQKGVRESLAQLKDSSQHFRFVRRDGTVRHGYSERKIAFDQNRKPIRIYGIVQDVTERKIAEEEREKITAEIVQRNKDLEQFSYIVSHNLRAPVANIIGLSEAVRSDNLGPEQKKEIMDALSTSVKKLDEVISDLNGILQTKRATSQKKELVRFSQLASNIHTSIEHLIEKERAVFLWDFSEIDEMLTLKSYIYSIFYNLISNSLKYRQPTVSPVIEIKSRMLANKIELTFKDNGMGIDLSKKGGQVFGLYKRFHTSVAEGKGMGLYMVKTQVESIGGKISIASEVNKGTAFTIEFER